MLTFVGEPPVVIEARLQFYYSYMNTAPFRLLTEKKSAFT
jgi:hypothetical protein